MLFYCSANLWDSCVNCTKTRQTGKHASEKEISCDISFGELHMFRSGYAKQRKRIFQGDAGCLHQAETLVCEVRIFRIDDPAAVVVAVIDLDQ